MPVIFIEVSDGQVLSWTERDSVAKARFKDQVNFVKLHGKYTSGIIYQGNRYVPTQVSVDRRDVLLRRLPPPAPKKERKPRDLIPPTDPSTLFRADDPETSKEAAYRLDVESGDYRVATCLWENPFNCPVGLADSDMQDVYKLKGWNHPEEWHKRAATLCDKGWCEDSGITRDSPRTGRPQIVWRLTEFGRERMKKMLEENG